MRKLFINLKYAFLKTFQWEDAYKSDYLREGEKYDIYINGKKYKNCKFLKSSDWKYQESIGLWPYLFELENGCFYNIAISDFIIFLPWAYSEEGKKYIKEKRKLWSIPQ